MAKEKNLAALTPLLLRMPDDGRKDRLGRVIAGHAGLAATGAIVNNDGGLA